LLNRPIVYYTPDLEDFLLNSRSLLFDPSEIAVGPMCGSFEELLEALEAVVRSKLTVCSEKRDEVMPRVHQFSDGHSSPRVLNVIDKRYFDGELASMPCPAITIL